ncbi:MAG: DUF159 family protein [Flavobacteriaceae bacterium]|nr:DUF159 family protein [Flavobacteriaceae bacterium]
MCYDIKASLESQLKRAKRRGNAQAVLEIEEKLAPLTDLPLHHATAFSHPTLFIYTTRSPNLPELATWGLIPHWVKGNVQKNKIWNTTVNARGESIFEKPSFRKAARENRCLVVVEGFYEHHHHKGKTYPFFVHSKDGMPLTLAGLWNEWVDEETGEIINTFSIITTEGNELMAKIHNNPKLRGPRMPLILPSEMEEGWLRPVSVELDIQKLQELIVSYPATELAYHTVTRLRGKDYPGNVETVCNPVAYKELTF